MGIRGAGRNAGVLLKLRNPVLGAIIGDMIGSPYEFDPLKGDNIPTDLWQNASEYTDDTVLTLVVYDEYNRKTEQYTEGFVQAVAQEPLQAWGGGFRSWAMDGTNRGYNHSLGNGCIMRLSPVPYLVFRRGTSREIALHDAMTTCRGSHHHVVSYAAVRAYTNAMLDILHQTNPFAAKKRLVAEGFSSPDLSVLREYYTYSERVDHTLGESYQCFLEADSFEDTMRNVIALKGDADTMCAIAGSFSAVAHGIPESYYERAMAIMQEPKSHFVRDRWASFMHNL